MDLQDLKEKMASTTTLPELLKLRELFSRRMMSSTAIALNPWVKQIIMQQQLLDERIHDLRMFGYYAEINYSAPPFIQDPLDLYFVKGNGQMTIPSFRWVSQPPLHSTMLKREISKITRGLTKPTRCLESIQAMSVCATTLSEQQWDILQWQGLSKLVGKGEAGRLVGLPSKFSK